MDKKILVLDVDETLLNVEPLFFLERFKKNYKKYEGKLFLDKYYLSPRPFLFDFIKEAKNHFRLVAFSVTDKEITKLKLGNLGILGEFEKIYGKEDLIENKKSLKFVAEDLNIDINNITAVDDIPELFLEQDNVIKIKPWFIGSNQNDNCLLNILENNVVKVCS